jgi:hypothetical protein
MKTTKTKTVPKVEPEPAWRRYYLSHRAECIARTMAYKRKKAAERRKAER